MTSKIKSVLEVHRMAVKISRFFLHVSLILTFVLPLQGEIFLPSFGNTKFVNERSDVEIPWTYDFGAKVVVSATWTFANDTIREQLAFLHVATNNLSIPSTIFPNINVTGQATLVLKNVNRYYSGTYRLTLNVVGTPKPTSDVMVIVKVRPTAVTNCSSVEVNEGDEIRCLCEGKHGNPPASVSWIKDGVTVAGPGSLQVLLVKNGSINVGGTYICKAQSRDLESNVSAQVSVKPYRPPTNVIISVMPASVVSGVQAILTCKADAHPAAQLRIVFNGKNVSYDGTYVITSASSEDSGTYQCIATNRLGSNSTNRTISVTVSLPTTESKVETSFSNTASAPSHNGATSDGLSGGAIAGIVIGVLVLLVIVFILVWKCRQYKDRKDGPGGGGKKDREGGERLTVVTPSAAPP